jgi:hypothetical protein
MLADLPAREVLERASAFGIEICLEGDRICVRAPGHIPPALAEYIRGHRTEIVALLKRIVADLAVAPRTVFAPPRGRE